MARNDAPVPATDVQLNGNRSKSTAIIGTLRTEMPTEARRRRRP
jgi:hypothetical protein